MGWLSGWSWAKEISLTGQTGAGTLYQVDLDIGDSAGGDFHLEGNCTNFPQDIEVTDNDGTTILDFSIEDITADPLKMWVEVADDLGSNQKIWVYYGKSGATTNSDGHATFRAFDDAETGDKTYWTEDNGGIEIVTDPKYGTYGIRSNQGSGGSGDFTSAGFIGNSETDFIYEGWVKPTNDWGSLNIRRSGTTTFYAFWLNSAGNTVQLTKMISAARTDITSGAVTLSLGTWYKFKITAAGTTLKIDIDDVNIINTTDSSIASGYVGIGGYRDANNREVVVDDIRVRKYNDPEPAFASAGAEQSAPSGHPTTRRWGGIPGMQYTGRRSW